ncbi:MAG: glycosyltransferase family A protein [Actinobacteria bacterium]|nr:glycosyltransferase family A protein [Actinomycetota bacterium]
MAIEQHSDIDLLSLIVVHYNIPREFPRTLFSLSPSFQKGISANDYEVIVVDNGSKELPDISSYRESGMNIRLLQVPNPNQSPARAINLGLNASLGKNIGVFIDGARMASPGLLQSAKQALRFSDRSIVATRGRYLGPTVQRTSMNEGYTKDFEDAMLGSLDWKNNGYRLFEKSVFDESSGAHWFDPRISESNSLFMSRALWSEINGFSEDFQSLGGGFLNLDTLTRATSLEETQPILLIGEATFHQLHGGVATNVPKENVFPMRAEYEAKRGTPYEPPVLNWLFFGNFKFRPALIEMGLSHTAKAILMEDAKNRKKDSAKNPVPEESAASQTDPTKISTSSSKNLIPQKNLRRLKRRLAKIKLVMIIWKRIIAIRRRIRKHNA